MLTPAELLLQKELGISNPGEIDLDAIAWHVGVQVRYRDLDGCEARIIGRGDKGIISVQASQHPRRRRFSVAHELGHWHWHRGRSFICRADDIGSARENKPQAEREADAYAADLLMPWYLFLPKARAAKSPSFELVRGLADEFQTSLTATALRLVDVNIFPIILVCHGMHGRKWFRRSKDVPERWFPRAELDADSFAFDVLFGTAGEHRPTKMSADAWFDQWDAEKFDLREQTLRISEHEVLTLLHIVDGAMLEDAGSNSRRRY